MSTTIFGCLRLGKITTAHVRGLGIVPRISLVTLILFVPPVIFEKYTYLLYLRADPNFFFFSGYRLWFDIIWFGVGGALSALIVGRQTRLVVLPPILSAFLFVISSNVYPFCAFKECYVSSTDGLAPLRDFLLFCSMGVITSAVSLRSWIREGQTPKRLDLLFEIAIVSFISYALSFYPLQHIFAGVSVAYPENYLQWFLAGAPEGLAASMLILDRGSARGIPVKVFGGMIGLAGAVGLASVLPCESCSGYPSAIISVLLMGAIFSVPAFFLATRRTRPLWQYNKKTAGLVATVTIVGSMVLMFAFFFATNYQASVVNSFSGMANSAYSPVEVGHTFVYSAGYLSIPRVTSQSVGVNVSFGNTTIDPATFPNDFLAAGIGDQSPNCCKDGLDLAYRADAIMFSNGTEAVVGRAWWACDLNMACGGYSWQQLLHIGSAKLPKGTLSNWIDLEMNWTSTTSIQWFYRVHFITNGSETPWILFSSFTPPRIQNHYWDAGLFPVGEANQPTYYAYFLQFGVSSAYPINARSWNVSFQCPMIVLENSWICLPHASFIGGVHSFWKVLYTFGESYRGVNFTYFGDYKLAFYYAGGKSPADETPIW
jgi:hypothetical protein